MNLIKICRDFVRLDEMSEHSVVCFTIKKEYPLLYFSQLITKITKDNNPFISIDLAGGEIGSVQAQLESSFLGASQRYWLGYIDALPKAALKQWQSYLDAYQGPNSLYYVTSYDQKQEKKRNSILIPDDITKIEFRGLYTFFVKEPNQIDLQRIDQFYMKADTIPLDTACLLLSYMRVMGSQSQEFYTDWLEQILLPKQSLFVLSQHLFAKKITSFLSYWHEVKGQYPEQFWISFWSDQLWRAAFYCKYMSESKITDAKTVGQRLPFSFLQKDYRLHRFDELYHAHQSLYDLDYDLKHGGSAIGLDLFLYNFFAGDYTSQQ
jgi:hypothetical protein